MTATPFPALTLQHQQLAQACTTLQGLATHLARQGSDDAAMDTARTLLRGVPAGMARHCATEEDGLLPALMESMAGSDACCLRDFGRRVGAEHRALEHLWFALRHPLECIERGEPAQLCPQDLDAFVAQCRAHISWAERELLPLAVRLLSDAQWAQLAAQAHRRAEPTDRG